MQKRKQLILDDAYFNFDDTIQAKGYEQQSYVTNRADSIWWARQRCKDDEEIRDFVFGLRAQFRQRLLKDFPGEAVIAPCSRTARIPTIFSSLSAISPTPSTISSSSRWRYYSASS